MIFKHIPLPMDQQQIDDNRSEAANTPVRTPHQVTMRLATREDLPAIIAIATEVALDMPSEEALYPRIKRYPVDRRRCLRYNYLVDYSGRDLFIIIAEREGDSDDESTLPERTNIGFLAWEYDPDRLVTSCDSPGTIRRRAGVLYDSIPKQSLWRRFLEWWYIWCYDVALWLDRSTAKPRPDINEPCGRTTQEQLGDSKNCECCYLLDLAVQPKYQSMGVGRASIRWGIHNMTVRSEAKRNLMVMLYANSGTQEYYTGKVWLLRGVAARAFWLHWELHDPPAAKCSTLKRVSYAHAAVPVACHQVIRV